MQEKIDSAVKKAFKPEFLNRLDGTIIFKPLDKTHLMEVIDLEVSKVSKRLARKKIKIALDSKAKDFLVDKGFQPEMGARPLRRVIEQYLEDPLAEQLLMHPDKGGNWLVTCENEKLVFQDVEEAASELVGASTEKKEP